MLYTKSGNSLLKVGLLLRKLSYHLYLDGGFPYILYILITAGSHYGRSHPWRGHEENTGQARPSGPYPWRGHEEKTWQARPSRIRDPPGWPRPLPHPVSSPLFLLLLLFALLQILVLPAESSPAPPSLNEDQLKTLINKSPGRSYPMKGPGMKGMLQFKPFCWHSGLFDKCVLPCKKCSWLF